MILNLKPDAIETFSPFSGLQKYWTNFADKNNHATIGGSDAHMEALIGTVWTEFPDECKTSSDYIEAIKAKKTSVGGIPNRKEILVKAGLEYLWKNSFGRPFLKF